MSIPLVRKPTNFFCSAKNRIISYKFHRFHNCDISIGELFTKLHWLSGPGNSVSFSNDHFLIGFGTIIDMIQVRHSFLMDKICDTMHMGYVLTNEFAIWVKKSSEQALERGEWNLPGFSCSASYQLNSPCKIWIKSEVWLMRY